MPVKIRQKEVFPAAVLIDVMNLTGMGLIINRYAGSANLIRIKTAAEIFLCLIGLTLFRATMYRSPCCV